MDTGVTVTDNAGCFSYRRHVGKSDLRAGVQDCEEHLFETQRADAPEDESDWSSLSLALAMRGMEDEEMPEYTLADLKYR
jgi:hypothetical protein